MRKFSGLFFILCAVVVKAIIIFDVAYELGELTLKKQLLKHMFGSDIINLRNE